MKRIPLEMQERYGDTLNQLAQYIAEALVVGDVEALAFLVCSIQAILKHGEDMADQILKKTGNA